MARHWHAQGAQRLHVVDLDGARDGVRENARVIRGLIEAVDIPVQVGGGIRALETAMALVNEGADRVVVGTLAAEQPESMAAWVSALGAERVIVGIDARRGYVATHGWQRQTDVRVLDFCETLLKAGVERVLYTDVSRDGRLVGPDLETTRQIATLLKVIGSGGVATVEDLRGLAEAGAEGAIIGTALYQGRLALGDALALTC
jgi:phosphoribosylformimino-5-aminoimidazole carboxamide ribotide isomerase